LKEEICWSFNEDVNPRPVAAQKLAIPEVAVDGATDLGGVKATSIEISELSRVSLRAQS
jgi:hypothetical protein